MNEKVHEPKRRITYYIIKPIARFLLFFVYNIRCKGRKNIPKKGGFILASNHISYTDPVILVSFCPRTCHFMAKSDLFKHPLLALFFRSMNAFPVKRGTSDNRSLVYAQKVLNSSWVLGIFPEGGTSKDKIPKRAKSGIAYLAKNTGADVLPVSIYRTPGKRQLRPKTTVRFGTVIKNEELGLTEEYSPKQLRAASQLIMNKIVALWEKQHE